MKHDLSTYYGYNSYLLDQITSLFPPGEVLELLEACETPRPVSGGLFWQGGRKGREADEKRPKGKQGVGSHSN